MAAFQQRGRAAFADDQIGAGDCIRPNPLALIQIARQRPVRVRVDAGHVGANIHQYASAYGRSQTPAKLNHV